MSPTVARRTKRSKRLSIPAHEQPETYNRLLTEYVSLAEAESVNPYEFSFKKRIRESISVREQLGYAKSPHIADFIKTPDTLAQELPAAKEMLKKLDTFDDQAIRSFLKLNNLNLARLRRRSMKNQIGPGIAFTASIIGLVLDFQDMLAISIKDSFAWFTRFNLSQLFQVVIVLIIVFALAIARVNWLFTTPRIGLVDAFGDILQIMMVHRNLKE